MEATLPEDHAGHRGMGKSRAFWVDFGWISDFYGISVDFCGFWVDFYGISMDFGWISSDFGWIFYRFLDGSWMISRT